MLNNGQVCRILTDICAIVSEQRALDVQVEVEALSLLRQIVSVCLEHRKDILQEQVV